MDLSGLEEGATAGRDVRRQREQQDPRGRLVEPVHRMDGGADLVTQELQREARLVRVEPRAVDEQTRAVLPCTAIRCSSR